MKYWLMKTEPDTFSIDDLQSDKSTYWDGVRNYQARNFMRDEMKKNDKVFIYHSNCKEPGIYGIGKVTREALMDVSAVDINSPYYDRKASNLKNPWVVVQVSFIEKLKKPVLLSLLKKYKDQELKNWQLLQRGNRLSILPVDFQYWNFILNLKTKD